MRFKTKKSRAAYENLFRIMNDEKLCPGGALPPERQLAEMAGVSRPTLRKILSAVAKDDKIKAISRNRKVFTGGSLSLAQRSTATVGIVWLLSGDSMPPPFPAKRGGGWDRYISFNIAARIQRERLNALMISPESLAERPGGSLLPSGIDALAFGSLADRSEFRKLVVDFSKTGFPVAGRGNEEWMRGFDRVESNHSEGARALAEWLLKKGRRRILRFWPYHPSMDGNEPEWLASRDAGFEQALAKAGVQPIPSVKWRIRSDGLEDDHEALTRLYAGLLADRLREDKRIDSIMAVSDGEAFHVASACRILGREPNKDIWITGYDNYWRESPELSLEPCFPIATIDKRNDLIGDAIAGLLIDRIAGKLPPEPQLKLVQPELLINI